MRWFEVESRFRHDPRMKKILRKFGRPGLASILLLWGEIADQGARPGVGVHRDGSPLEIEDLARACAMTPRTFRTLVDYAASIGHVEPDRWRRDGVIVLPGMVRRAKGLTAATDEAGRKTEQRAARFERIAQLRGGAKCCRCGERERRLELERIVPEDEGGGTEDANLQLVCVSCGRKRRSARERAGAAVSTDHRPMIDRSTNVDRLINKRSTNDQLDSGILLGNAAEGPQDVPQDVPQDAVQGTGRGVVPDSIDRSTHTQIARAREDRTGNRPTDGKLPLLGVARPPAYQRGVNPAQRARGPADGLNPRDHLNCFDAPCGRVCIPIRLHNDLMRRLGGDDEAAKVEQLRAFYREVLEQLPAASTIGEDDFKFWRAWFAQQFPSAAPPVKHAKRTGLTGPAPRGKYDRLNNDGSDQADQEHQDEQRPPHRRKPGM